MKITIGKSFHAQAAHHGRLAKLHETQYKILSEKAATSTDALQKSVHEAQRDFHKAAQTEHEDECERCEMCAKTIDIEIESGLEDEGGDSSIQDNSGAGEELLNAALGEERFIKLVPDRVRATFTTTTGPLTPSIMLVPRFGSPQPQTSTRPSVGEVDFLDLGALESD